MLAAFEPDEARGRWRDARGALGTSRIACGEPGTRRKGGETCEAYGANETRVRA